ncbi:MAG TPA: glycoside hydrolase family 2 protein [Meiothermus sp.]|nr:glycoside hydrolase family 2 protein [Meiothermus sp.]
MTHTRLELSHDWLLKQRDPRRPLDDLSGPAEGWLPARVPGDVYQTLLEAGKIPDPFYGLNELEVQWVGEADWWYRLDFEVPAELFEAPHLDLCFDGLDTFATVWLNGEEILRSDNMFVPHRVAVRERLRPGKNSLHLLFESALRRGREMEARYGQRRCWNGDPSRLYVRKAQYHYGWDWGPTLLTAGPWKGICLEAYSARIADLHAPVELSDDLGYARISVEAALEGGFEGSELEIRLLAPNGTVAGQTRVAAEKVSRGGLEVTHPQLWWPNGYGAQPLYTLEVRLYREGQQIARQATGIGLRRLRVVQEPVEGEPGSSFYFEVNNLPIFAGGANWIPDDNLLGRLTPERYRERVRQAALANLVMLRVWGGGIYEDDAFYRVCDELGVLVWQDFMFACGLYPAHREFLEGVRLEAQAQIKRLRHHPSLALWCGNNEDYQIAEAMGLYGPGKDTAGFEALAIYEKLLPEVCGQLDPTRFYWPGSPYGGESVFESTVGDRHTWEVWHGAMYPYSQYRRFEGRFVSEFGMQAFPSRAVLEAAIPPPERFPQSRTVEHHNKAWSGFPDGHRRLAVYLADTLRTPVDLEGYIYATQFVQAEALGYAYRDFRRRWGRPGGRAVGGALVWQLNDCWPVTSWAVIDSAGIPKPAYSVIRRAMAPLVLGLSPEGEVWAVNGTPQARTLDLELSAFSLDGERLATERKRVVLEPNATTELGRWELPGQVVGAARLLEGEGVVARATRWPEPFKYHRFPDPGLSLEQLGDDEFRLSVQRPAKGVVLEAEGVRWSDNFLDLLPGDPQTVRAEGLKGAGGVVRWLDGSPFRFEVGAARGS